MDLKKEEPCFKKMKHGFFIKRIFKSADGPVVLISEIYLPQKSGKELAQCMAHILGMFNPIDTLVVYLEKIIGTMPAGSTNTRDT